MDEKKKPVENRVKTEAFGCIAVPSVTRVLPPIWDRALFYYDIGWRGRRDFQWLGSECSSDKASVIQTNVNIDNSSDTKINTNPSKTLQKEPYAMYGKQLIKHLMNAFQYHSPDDTINYLLYPPLIELIKDYLVDRSITGQLIRTTITFNRRTKQYRIEPNGMAVWRQDQTTRTYLAVQEFLIIDAVKKTYNLDFTARLVCNEEPHRGVWVHPSVEIKAETIVLSTARRLLFTVIQGKEKDTQDLQIYRIDIVGNCDLLQQVNPPVIDQLQERNPSTDPHFDYLAIDGEWLYASDTSNDAIYVFQHFILEKAQVSLMCVPAHEISPTYVTVKQEPSNLFVRNEFQLWHSPTRMVVGHIPIANGQVVRRLYCVVSRNLFSEKGAARTCVMVFDLTDPTNIKVVQTISRMPRQLLDEPTGLALSESGSFLYVTNKDTVQIFDTQDGSHVKTIHVVRTETVVNPARKRRMLLNQIKCDTKLTDIAIDGKRVYVADEKNQCIHILENKKSFLNYSFIHRAEPKSHKMASADQKSTPVLAQHGGVRVGQVENNANVATGSAPADIKDTLANLHSAVLDEKTFITLLSSMMDHVKDHLMNKPPQHVPQESMAGRHVLAALEPYTVKQGGPLLVRTVEHAKGRANIIIEYPSVTAQQDGAKTKTVSFVGSHLDVVHADPAQWAKNPFGLQIDGDILHGRGTTDCLGHVSLLTCLFQTLAKLKPALKVSVIGVIIVDEEVGDDPEIGVCGLMKRGELEKLKNGPVFWLDCADKQPNIASGGLLKWKLTTIGKTFHSGFPHKTVNAIELGMDVVSEIQRRFYKDFPPHLLEKDYLFPCSSSLKPTVVQSPDGSINQIKGSCVIEGDIRLTPWYKIKEVRLKINEWVQELQKSSAIKLQGQRGPDAKYANVGDVKTGIEWSWTGAGVDGLACDLKSEGFKVLCDNTKRVVGHCQPLSDTGALPLVADLRAAGYDIQTIGYGVEDAYHADNEFARLSDFKQGFQVLAGVIVDLNSLA